MRKPKAPKPLLRLFVGNAGGKQDGFLTAGNRPDLSYDVSFDFASPAAWPWAAESVEYIVCPLYFHVLTGGQRIRFMNEAYRVLKTGGQMMIIVPYWSSMRAIADPTLAWPPLCQDSFSYFNKGFREGNGLKHYPITCDFDYGYGAAWEPETATRNEETQRLWMKQYLNAVNDLHVTLTKRP